MREPLISALGIAALAIGREKHACVRAFFHSSHTLPCLDRSGYAMGIPTHMLVNMMLALQVFSVTLRLIPMAGPLFLKANLGGFDLNKGGTGKQKVLVTGEGGARSGRWPGVRATWRLAAARVGHHSLRPTLSLLILCPFLPLCSRGVP